MSDSSDPLHTELRDLIIAKLVCPFCTAENTPAQTNIDLVEIRCICRTCSKDGPLSDFQPEAH